MPTRCPTRRTAGQAEVRGVVEARRAISLRACAICGNDADNRIFTAREMMFGLRESFDYLECSKCGCLQQLDVPEDLSRLYDNYYSFDNALPATDRRIAATIKRLRAPVLLRVPAGVVDALVRARLVPSPFMWLAGLASINH
jgi:hypothetical protein